MKINKKHIIWFLVFVLLTLALTSLHKRIEIDVSEGILIAYQGIFKVIETPVVLGGIESPTCIGEFEVLNKLEDVQGILDYTFPKWLGIYEVGAYENGIHSVAGEHIWNEYSSGSVILQPESMEELFNWAKVGTPVIIKP